MLRRCSLMYCCFVIVAVVASFIRSPLSVFVFAVLVVANLIVILRICYS